MRDRVPREEPWETMRTYEDPIGRIAGFPMDGKWNAWVTQQGAVWVDRSNRVYLISEMSERYAFNILRFLWENHFEDLGDPRKNPLVIALVGRIEKQWLNYRLQVEMQRGFGGVLMLEAGRV